jgi:uncharacterized protein
MGTAATTDPVGAGDRRALELLGLAKRAGVAAVGTQAVREAARRGSLRLLLIARDAGGNARDRVLPLARAVEVPWAECGTTASLGQALGRGRTVVAGIEEPRLAARVLELLGPEATGRERRRRRETE